MRQQWSVLAWWVMAAFFVGAVGCDKQSEETKQALRRAEKAEKRVQNLGQTVETLTAQKKDLELEIMGLKESLNKAQSGIADSNEANNSLEMQLQQIKAQNTSLTTQVADLRTEIRDKDRQIQELDALAKTLAGTVPEGDTSMMNTPVTDTVDTTVEGNAIDDVTEE